jgi:translation initiation factor IF-3
MSKGLKEKIISTTIRINDQIRSGELRVIGAEGQQLGIMSRSDALLLAEQAGLDLVEISPNAAPPVVKIIDWGKYQYQKMKEQQKSRKNAKAVELKQMRLGLKIGSNDLSIKLRKITEFLNEGHKVKILVVFKGREMAHQELGYQLMEKIISLLPENSVVEQQPLLAGRNLSITVRSK